MKQNEHLLIKKKSKNRNGFRRAHEFKFNIKQALKKTKGSVRKAIRLQDWTNIKGINRMDVKRSEKKIK